MRFSTSCAVHGVRLVDQCPDCREQLVWRDAWLRYCQECEADLHDAPTTAVPMNRLAGQVYLENLLLDDGAPRPEFLSGLSFYEVRRVLERLGELRANVSCNIGHAYPYSGQSIPEVKEAVYTLGLEYAMMDEPSLSAQSARRVLET